MNQVSQVNSPKLSYRAEIENNIRLLVNTEAALQAGVETNEANDMIPVQIN